MKEHITPRQIGNRVWIRAALDHEAPRVIDLQAGCSFALLTRDELVRLRDALTITLQELDRDGVRVSR